jgi:hypothetical protein
MKKKPSDKRNIWIWAYKGRFLGGNYSKSANLHFSIINYAFLLSKYYKIN